MPKIVTGELSHEEVTEIEASKTKSIVDSNLECFKITNGIRPSEFSVIVGKQGNGKSGLCKTIGFEAARSGINSLFILSEEKSSVYKSNLTEAFKKFGGSRTNEFLSRLYFDSMLDWTHNEKNLRFFFEHLEEQINKLETDLVIFDNFTTSFIGQLSISDQGKAIEQLRILASTYEIAIVGVFHTIKKTDIYKSLLDGEDVRGNSTSTNAGSYNYILTTFFRATPVKAILFIDKARYHKEANKTYWELLYDKETELYIGAKKTSYDNIMVTLNEVSQKTKDKMGGKDKSGW